MSGWIDYDSNNSGGSFWLKDADWKALADAGWHVEWNFAVKGRYARYGHNADAITVVSGRRYGDSWEKASAYPVVGEPEWPDCKDETGIIAISPTTHEEAVALREKHGGYFGTLAVSACKRGDSPEELVAEFERITGQDASDQGCNCCGQPHNFTWHDDDGSTKYANAVVTRTELSWS